MNTDTSQYIDDQYPDSFGSDILSIALIGPDDGRRRTIAEAIAGCQSGGVREFTSYPPSLDDVPKLLEQRYDVIIMDLDSNPEYALELVESICANGASTVMIYSGKADSELLVRCMRAGAREFLTLPFAQSTMAEALVRASARRPAPRAGKKAGGRLLAFLGAKGGDGVTTLACNYAVSLAQESGQSTLLIDLVLPLGDAALNLGVVAEYSAINALQNVGRLDSSFLSKLLVKHSSGLSVLAAPGKFQEKDFDATNEAIDRLIAVARQDFDNVVIDMGSRLDLMGTSLFKDGSTVYLVIQAGIAGLRNSNRLISQYFSSPVPKLEIVLNRFEPRTMGVSEDQITKALTRPAQWKIPNDYNAVRRMQTTAIPLAMEDSPISRIIRQMARTVCGLPPAVEKKAGFSLKSLRSSISSKVSSTSTEESSASSSSAFTQLGLGSSQDEDSSNQAQQESATKNNGKSSADSSTSKRGSVQSISSSKPSGELETRTYKGSTYVKGTDGEWHLQGTEPGAESKPRAAEQPRVVEQPRTHVQASFSEQTGDEEQEATFVAWSTPAPIAYGTPLSGKQLRAMASVPGKFVYNPGAGEILEAGSHLLRVDFTPADLASHTKADSSVTLAVTKGTPAIAWPAPAPIVYGAALTGAQLNAKAQVPGKFSYTPAEGEVLSAGVQTLSTTFAPSDAVNYNPAQAAVSVTVAKAASTISWANPAAIGYGTALTATQLNAKASVPGRFTYSPSAGEVLTAGNQTLTAIFTPTDGMNYASAEATVQLSVTKSTPTIKWPKPAPITYGTALSAAQLNAEASTAGRFTYIPSAGAVLAAGTHTPSVTFMPTDTTNYTGVRAAVPLTVTKATPVISWSAPTPIVYGTALSAAQLDASASVPGTLVYSPAVGEVLTAGTHTLSVTFTPNDTTDYAAVRASVTLSVTKAKPTLIAWSQPASIIHGTTLSTTQLNATAPVPGSFVYNPPAGKVLPTGTHALSVTFTPTDTNFPPAQVSVSLTVVKSTPTIKWPTPAVITYGTALSAQQLNASASVPGSFTYSPSAGEVFAAGTHTLSATFTPNDSADVASAQATVTLTVAKATPIVTWQTPSSIQYGTPLSNAQLNAAALVPGSFTYTPAAGTVLTAGKQTLSVTFTPKDTLDYTTAQATVSLVVEGLDNFDSLMPMSFDDEPVRSEPADARRGGSTPSQQGKLETRFYKGATYEKGADGQWYLQKN